MTKDRYHHMNLKQELIDAGTRLILDEGVDSLSLRRLATECGVSHAAPYKHFKSKEDILSAILNQAELAFIQELTTTLHTMQGATPKERLVQIGVAYVQFMIENPDYFRLLFFSGMHSLHFVLDLTKIPEPETSLGLFYEAAVAHLVSIDADARNRATDILAMWAMVHGLAVMLVNRTLIPEQREDYRSIVQKILCNNLTFPNENES